MSTKVMSASNNNKLHHSEETVGLLEEDELDHDDPNDSINHHTSSELRAPVSQRPTLSKPSFKSIPPLNAFTSWDNFWNTKYLTPNVLRGFENYKYSSMDTSPLSTYVMHPFWNWVVKFCPPTLAPNLLTFTGFLFTLANFVLLSFYDWGFTAADGVMSPDQEIIPRWVWVAAAFNLFMSHTLDGIDGKQARNTGSSSPLGELFDHGLDSWTTVFIPTGLYSVFGRDPTYSISITRMFWCYWNVFYNFIFSHWEKYNTGILYLPWGYDASMVACLLTFTFTAIYGPAMWKFTFTVFGLTLTSGNVVEFLLYAGSIGLSMPVAIWNVVRSYTHPTPTSKLLPIRSSLRPLLSPTILLALSAIWINISSTPLDVMPRIFFYSLGTIFSHICCTLIVSQMSNTVCELLDWTIAPVALVTLLRWTGIIGPLGEQVGIWGVALISTLGLVQFGCSVVRQMCYHFNIDCFSITKRNFSD